MIEISKNLFMYTWSLRDVVRRNGLKANNRQVLILFLPHQNRIIVKVIILLITILGNYYLCDGRYTNVNGFVSSYQGYRYWLKDWPGDNLSLRCQEDLFNMKHIKARNVIERTFGLLKRH